MRIKKLTAVCLAAAVLAGCTSAQPAPAALPSPEPDSGMRGELGIDKNVNEASIDSYLNREDSVYRDMRMLKDEADYEAIGGDSYLSGYVDGFEIVPYPYLCNVVGLPEAVGSSYTGTTLFTTDGSGTYTANYEESMDILEDLFPKDKTIFLMCGGGGYAGMTKNLLVSLGWDGNKIYNTGGFWYYEGQHAVQVKREENGSVYYDFHKVPYHYIDFEALHALHEPASQETAAPGGTEAKSDILKPVENNDQLKKMIESGETFVLYVYLPGCTSCAAFKPVIEAFAGSDQVPVYQVSYEDVKKSGIEALNVIEYTPAVFLFENGEAAAYLDPHSDDDLPYYKTAEMFSKWLSQYADIEIVVTDDVNETENCEDACIVTAE